MMSQDWHNVVRVKGWDCISFISVGKGTSLSLKADLEDAVAPNWCALKDLPCWVTGAKYEEVPWDYGSRQQLQVPEFAPHLVYSPRALKSDIEGFAQLHAACLSAGVALKFVTAAATPNLQIAVLLVAGHRRQQPAGAAAPALGPGARPPLPRNQQQQPQQQQLQRQHQSADPDPQEAHHSGPQAPPVGGLFRAARPEPAAAAAGAGGEPFPVAAVAASEAPGAAAYGMTASGMTASGMTGTSSGGARAQAATVAAAAGGRAAPASAVRCPPLPPPKRCFHAYFLPLRPGRDVRADGEKYNAWVRRRLVARRNCDKDRDLQPWKEDQRVLDRDPLTGLPLREQLVTLHSYDWDAATSPFAAATSRLSVAVALASSGPGGSGCCGPVMHCSRVKSVLPGRTFTYSMRPWRRKPDDPAGTLEPVMDDQQEDFLRECGCSEGACGKLRAREELKRLREDGVQYLVEVRQATALRQQAEAGAGPGGGARGPLQLGVFAGGPIPADTFLFEYVGEWLPAGEPTKREAVYEPAGLHYLYDLVRRDSPSAAPAAGKKASCGASGGGGGIGSANAGGGGGGRKRRHRGSSKERWQAGADGDDGDDDLLPVVVDATHVGNVARFVNHRCEGANLESVNVCMGGLDERYMTIMMRTRRPIGPGEELTLDYQAGQSPELKDRMRSKPEGLVPCKCGSARCLGFVFPTLPRPGDAAPGGYRRTAMCARSSQPPPLPTQPVAARSAAAAAARSCAASLAPASPSPSSSSFSTSTSRDSEAATSGGFACGGAAAAHTTAVAAAGLLAGDCPSSGLSGLPSSTALATGARAEREQGQAEVAMVGAEADEGDCCTSAAAAAAFRGGGGGMAGGSSRPVMALALQTAAGLGAEAAVAVAVEPPPACAALRTEHSCGSTAAVSSGADAAATAARRHDAARSPARPGVMVIKRIRLTLSSAPSSAALPSRSTGGGGAGGGTAAATAAATAAGAAAPAAAAVKHCCPR